MPLITDPRWDPQINDWVGNRGGGFQADGHYTALGWTDGHRIVGGLIFYSANPVNCYVNFALEPGYNPRGLLRAGLRYVFRQLGLRRLTFFISSANIASISFVKALGAIHEATLRGAEPEGDLLIYALFPDSCPLWSRIRGKEC